jgi:hypothetical protein
VAPGLLFPPFGGQVISCVARILNRVLRVAGHRSGQMISFPVAIADYEGERYLVAILGQNATTGATRTRGSGVPLT